MLKIALIGCGKIADSHAVQIARVPGCRIIAACDSEPLMAAQFAERFGVPSAFTSVHEMLSKASPDVVHITTPPQSHFPLAMDCLNAGSHVYVEKPFTVLHRDAEVLIQTATAARRLITVGHDDQYSHVARAMRAQVQAGKIGGAPLHMDSIYCYDLTEPGYATALLNDKNHWVRHLPGQLLQNVISHGIARVAEWFQTDRPETTVVGFTSQRLQALGEFKLRDELRVIISEGDVRTAYFTFSSQLRPAIHSFRLFGARGALYLDEDQQTLLYTPEHRLKSYAEKFIPAARIARQGIGNLARNLRLFARNDFHMKSGMYFLMSSLYDAVRQQGAPPIPYSEILRTSRIMEDIFSQLSSPHVREQLRAG
jgi:predicted dehydrogenase